MADLVKIHRVPDNVIADKPWRFRRAEWATSQPLMCGLHQAAQFEDHRREVWRPGRPHVHELPLGVTLDAGQIITVQGVFRHLGHEENMRQVMYAAGLMEAMINYPSPILRTDLIRAVYQRLETLSRGLGVVWRGRSERFLPTLSPQLYHPNRLSGKLARINNLQVFYDTIREETDDQFDLVARHYVFYVPAGWAPPDRVTEP
jgi:hypothetical protein